MSSIFFLFYIIILFISVSNASDSGGARVDGSGFHTYSLLPASAVEDLDTVVLDLKLWQPKIGPRLTLW